MGGAVGGDDGGWNTVSSKQIRPQFDLMKFRLPKVNLFADFFILYIYLFADLFFIYLFF